MKDLAVIVLDLTATPSAAARNEATQLARDAYCDFVAALIRLTENDRRAAAELEVQILRWLLPGMRRTGTFRGPFS